MIETKAANGCDTRSEPLYELRGLSLYVNGERLPVSAGAILTAVQKHHVRTQRLLECAAGVARVPEELAHDILAIERGLAVGGLADELRAA